ncbi:hypothetical protein D3C80_1600870 [compost metagenome]
MPAQAKAGRAALPVPQIDEAALAGEDLGRQLTAVLPGHRPLHALDDGRGEAAVILELFGAVVHGDAGLAAQVLVVGAFIGVLETPPAADVVDEDGLEVGPPGLDIGQQPLERVPALDLQAALALVGVGLDDLEATACGVGRYDVRLVLGGVFLVLGRHTDVLRRAHRRLRRRNRARRRSPMAH